ncbi:arginine-tRNA-protein transferase [Luteibacter sp. UNCMF331Sha3.1]|uniref:arginyltransferase n=1 Tax=Luteibacter sp. UNCMF331Sha3.1 TaxID=1502760 RepID=UPI0008CD3569|nr:arginyltransferase [Luteibacter sp. UNCMF331Sha3.1]SEM91954.1 arginine-tRNA-protein transferase [Luteibacter sp. UNCMF331Sha3.1]
MTDRVRLFQTLPHSCGYYAERTAQNLVVDPGAPHLDRLYAPALAKGFRRAGGHLYLPQCTACQACVPCRIDVAAFAPDRTQRRCLTRNADLTVIEAQAGFTHERHALYRRYLHARHSGGGMDAADADDFQRFLSAPWSPTLFVEFRQRDRLLGIAVTDVTLAGVSAVYTFFDPDEGSRSLGTFGILQQVALAKRRGIPYVYLGFWIAGHPKMDYKRRFKPLEIRKLGRWIAMP